RSRATRLPLRPPSRRLQARCSGPVHPLRSSLCPRSHGSSGLMGCPHRAQSVWPAATRGSHLARSVCRALDALVPSDSVAHACTWGNGGAGCVAPVEVGGDLVEAVTPG